MTLSAVNYALDNAFLLDDKDLLVAKSKRGQHNQLVFAVMLKFFELNHRFPNLHDTITNLVEILAWQLDCEEITELDASDRSYERFRLEVRKQFGFKRLS